MKLALNFGIKGALFLLCIFPTVLFGQGKFEFVNFSQVNITDDFWKPKIDKVATNTLNACIYQTETVTPRIRNFEKVARKKGEKHEGIYFDDSDVYKALEAIGYSLKTRPNKDLEKKADEWIDKIAAAQLPDGYLNTYYTLGDLSKRWTDVEKHEDYCAGHLIEAAVAYYDATGKRKLLDVSIRFANHIDSTFRLGNKKWFSGHEEIELALVKLYKVTKDDRYLKLADWYLQQRGHRYYDYTKSWITPAYWQDTLAIKDQKEITGHAVRAMYLYTGAADVAAITGDEGYINAMKAVWQDVVHRNMYVTGGIGSAGHNEGFTVDYDLPNEDAYCETCASVGMVFWNQRMSKLTADGKYMDVLERSLYNSALDGLSLDGETFFYDNPLASRGQHSRRAWFGVACCPSNIARLVSSVGGYIYGKSDDGMWVNLFVNSDTKLSFGNNNVAVKTTTAYPWNGNIKFNIDPDKKLKTRLYVRVPGWSTGKLVDGDLYLSSNGNNAQPVFNVNGKPAEIKMENGYAVIERTWKKGDVVEYVLPMDILRIKSKQTVPQDRERVALQRGPIVYCLEGADNNGEVWDIVLPEKAALQAVEQTVKTERVTALKGEALQAVPDQNGSSISLKPVNIVAIPYYTWANRGAGSMQVWIPEKLDNVRVQLVTKD